MIGQGKRGTTKRSTYNCKFCPPGSNTSEDAVPLVLSGDEGSMIASLLEITGNEACCYHCKLLITKVVAAAKRAETSK